MKAELSRDREVERKEERSEWKMGRKIESLSDDEENIKSHRHMIGKVNHKAFLELED